MNASIKRMFQDPKVGLVGISALRRKLHDRGIKATNKQIEEALGDVEAFTLPRNAPKKGVTRKVEARDVMQQLQADLIFMDVPQGAPASQNDGVKYLLNVIDVLSKYAWSVPLKDHKGETLAEALEPIIVESGCELLQVDKGTEFYNKDVETMLKRNGVKMFSTESEQKASIVERFNRTLKNKMGRLFEVRQNFRYIDALPDLIENYNNTEHRTIGMTPEEALDPKNYQKLMDNFYRDRRTGEKNKWLKVGDVVRIPILRSKFTKEAIGSWTVALYKIAKVFKTNPITYEIEDLLNEPIQGKFYGRELQKVSKDLLDQAFRIDKVIKTRGTGKKKEALVSFIGYDERFDAWVSFDQVQDL